MCVCVCVCVPDDVKMGGKQPWICSASDTAWWMTDRCTSRNALRSGPFCWLVTYTLFGLFVGSKLKDVGWWGNYRRVNVTDVNKILIDNSIRTTIFFRNDWFFLIQGIHKRMVRFQKLTRSLFLTLHGHNVHRQQRQLSKFLMRCQHFASHAYCGASFQDGVAAGKGFLCAPFWGVKICDYSAAWVSCTV